ncbi:MAG: CDP-alcohol phosphatidyltransferase family protein [Paramuribaculum sp.]|nr:CDP-alcohol phosphatidyltransferase family protein [Paramuribaculum sp.]MDE6048515.1 CDP-alcohol phosphatidyltransferase family protein [Paramuribaculum sp.]
MGNENAKRIQTSLLNSVEKKVLVWLAMRMPKWVTSDMLTWLGFAAAVAYAVFCWLANENVNYLWLSSLCLVLNWFGDALDGNLARVRNTQRPKYGFFIDHSIDALTTCLFCIGLGLTPFMSMNIALFIMIGYLSLSLHTYICTMTLGEFRLTYASLGPTEVRLILILISIIYIYNPFGTWSVKIFGKQWSVYDFAGSIVALALGIMYVVSVITDARKFPKGNDK